MERFVRRSAASASSSSMPPESSVIQPATAPRGNTMEHYFRGTSLPAASSSRMPVASSAVKPAAIRTEDDTGEVSSTSSDVSVGSIQEAAEETNKDYLDLLRHLQDGNPAAVCWVKQTQSSELQETSYAGILRGRAKKILFLIASIKSQADARGPKPVKLGLGKFCWKHNKAGWANKLKAKAAKVLRSIHKSATQEAPARLRAMQILEQRRSSDPRASSLYDLGLKLCDPTWRRSSMQIEAGALIGQQKRCKRRRDFCSQWHAWVSKWMSQQRDALSVPQPQEYIQEA